MNQKKEKDWRFKEILLQDQVVSVFGFVEPGEVTGLEVLGDFTSGSRCICFRSC